MRILRNTSHPFTEENIPRKFLFKRLKERKKTIVSAVPSKTEKFYKSNIKKLIIKFYIT